MRTTGVDSTVRGMAEKRDILTTQLGVRFKQDERISKVDLTH